MRSSDPPLRSFTRGILVGATAALCLVGAAPAFANVAGTITQLTTGSSTATQTSPQVSGTRIVWTDVSTNFDVWLLDLASGNPATNITNTPDNNEYLEDIDGTDIVFTRTGTATAGDIVVYDVVTGYWNTIAAALGGVHYEQPAIKGRYIVYVKFGAHTDIDGYDNVLGLPLAQPITNDDAEQVHPRVSGDIVVWEDYRNGDADVYSASISAGTQSAIATGAGAQSWPDVDGSWIVWVDSSTGTDQIWAYNVSTGTRRQLTSVASTKLMPRISGNRVVWADDRSGNLDVYLYDLSTNIEDVVVNGPGDQTLSDIDGDRVVFTSNASGFESVFLFTITPPPPPPPPPGGEPRPEGCDDAKTSVVAGPIDLAHTRGRSAGSVSYGYTAGKRYFVCIENGDDTGKDRTRQLLVSDDWRLLVTPANFHPTGRNSTPPRWISVPIPADGRAIHQLTAAIFGRPGDPSEATITVRVAH